MVGGGNVKLDGTVAGDAYIGAEVVDSTESSRIEGNCTTQRLKSISIWKSVQVRPSSLRTKSRTIYRLTGW